MTLFASVGDDLSGIAFSALDPSGTPHLFVAAQGACGVGPARIIDVTSGRALPKPFTGYATIIGLDSRLQFSNWMPGSAYVTSEAV